jgi:hypothetical protein
VRGPRCTQGTPDASTASRGLDPEVDDIVRRGGNVLLDIGPDGDGTILIVME